MEKTEQLGAWALKWGLLACLLVVGCAITGFSIATGSLVSGFWVGLMWASGVILIAGGLLCLVSAAVVVVQRVRRRTV